MYQGKFQDQMTPENTAAPQERPVQNTPQRRRPPQRRRKRTTTGTLLFYSIYERTGQILLNLYPGVFLH